jgi:hypothetical protein
MSREAYEASMRRRDVMFNRLVPSDKDPEQVMDEVWEAFEDESPYTLMDDLYNDEVINDRQVNALSDLLKYYTDQIISSMRRQSRNQTGTDIRHMLGRFLIELERMGVEDDRVESFREGLGSERDYRNLIFEITATPREYFSYITGRDEDEYEPPRTSGDNNAMRDWSPSDFVSQPLPDINYIAPERYGDPQGYLEQPRSRANTTGTDPAEDFYPDEDPSGSGRRRKSRAKVYKMPYKLRKCPNKDLYWVVNKETGQKHSKEGLPKEQAKAQMRALYANEKRGAGVLASHPAVDTLYEKADAFTASLEADNTRQLAQEASRAKNKGAMELAMTTSMPKEEEKAKGGKRSHKAQHIRYMLGKLKEKQKGYNKPFTPFNPNLVSKGNRSMFLNRMMKEGKVVPKRDAKSKPVEEKVIEKVVEKKTDGRKKKTVRLSETLEEAPTPVATTPPTRDERIKQLKAEGLSTRAIADKMKAEGFKKVSASTVSNVLKSVKGSGYDEHPEDFFF